MGFPPTQRHLKCRMPPTGRITPLMGLLPCWRYRMVTLSRGPYPEDASNLSMGCTTLQATFVQVPARMRPHVFRYITPQLGFSHSEATSSQTPLYGFPPLRGSSPQLGFPPLGGKICMFGYGTDTTWKPNVKPCQTHSKHLGVKATLRADIQFQTKQSRDNPGKIQTILIFPIHSLITSIQIQVGYI